MELIYDNGDGIPDIQAPNQSFPPRIKINGRHYREYYRSEASDALAKVPRLEVLGLHAGYQLLIVNGERFQSTGSGTGSEVNPHRLSHLQESRVREIVVEEITTLVKDLSSRLGSLFGFRVET